MPCLLVPSWGFVASPAAKAASAPPAAAEAAELDPDDAAPADPEADDEDGGANAAAALRLSIARQRFSQTLFDSMLKWGGGGRE